MIVSSLCQHQCHPPNFYYEFGYWANEPFLYPFPQTRGHIQIEEVTKERVMCLVIGL